MYLLRVPILLVPLFAACGDTPVAEAQTSETSSTGEGEGTTTATDSTGATTEVPTTGDAAPSCSNGVVEGDEVCDDGIYEAKDGCDEMCRPTAKVLWTLSLDGGSGQTDDLHAVALDAAGNIYVAGQVQVDGQSDAVLRKLDPAGEELLVLPFAGAAGLADLARAVVVGDEGSIYAGGFEALGAGEEVRAWVAKYDPAGAQQWLHTRESAVVGGGAFVGALAVAGDSVYVAGRENVDDLQHIRGFVERLDADGAALWQAELADSWNDSNDGLAVTPAGNLLLARGVQNSPDVGQPWLGEFGPGGALLWSSTYLPEGGLANDVAVAPDGAIALAGAAQNGGHRDVWVARLDPTGALVWSDSFDISGKGDQALGVGFAADGGVYIGGYVHVMNEQSNGYVRRYSPDGEVYWTDIHNGDAGLIDRVYGLAVGATAIVAVGTEFALTKGQNQWIRAYAP